VGLRIRVSLGLLAGLLGFTADAAEPALNLAEHARITASSVREQQNPGWIFDELDGPQAVRDGNPSTGWAPAAEGEQRLLLDFAFLNPAPFELREVSLQWSPPPRGGLRLLFGDGPDSMQEVASADDGATRLLPDGRPRGRYLALVLENPGPDARLVEIGVRGTSDEPEPPEVDAEPAPGDSLRLSWSPLDRRVTHHIEIHRSRDAGFTPSAASLLAMSFGEQITIPAPRAEEPVGLELAVVAVGFDGRTATAARRPTQTARPAGEAAFRIRGVIEGFYGRPWPHRQRLAMIRTLGGQGFNLYAYAPKDAPGHRAAWRDAPTLEELDRFAELLAAGVRHGVRVAYSLSPGLSLDPDSDEDFHALTTNLDPLLDIGFRDFGLLLDDIPVRPNAETGSAHARFASRLKSYLNSRAGPRASLFFVPTVYSGLADSMDDGQRAYLETLAALPDDVPVVWTGPKVFSREIRADYASAVRELLGGQPLIVWDNYPVNDAGARRDLFLGGIIDRDISLSEVIEGVLINPMVQGAASRIPVRAYGDLLHQPTEYDARQSFERALAAEIGDGDRACLVPLCEYFTGSDRVSTHAADAVSLRAGVDALLGASAGTQGGEFSEAALELARLLGQAWRSETCLFSGLQDLDLIEDLLPASRAVSQIGEYGLDGLRLLQQKRLGEPDSVLVQRLRVARLAQRRTLWAVGDGVGHRWLESVLALPISAAVEAGPRPPRLAVEAPPEARVGEPVAFDVLLDPPAEDARFHLVGPEDMRIDGTGRVTWSPSRAGRCRALIIAASPGGVDFARIELMATPSPFRPRGAGGPAFRLTASAFVILAALVLLVAAARRHARMTRPGA